MRALIICVSESHGNTRRVADAMADELDAQALEPEEVTPGGLGGYDLVGFGSGVFNFRLHRRLRQLVESLPAASGMPAFVFATSGFGRLIEKPPTVARLLTDKGYQVIGAFCCPGFDTSPLVRLVGGINRGRPDQRDLEAARAFARRMARRAAGPGAG